ncbi:MAG: M23 family metallopeptidase [Paludibacter sp.]|nr:M23 family metallopeptidase [Paludibacter sp.]MDD4197954.1 M23 family metallopeptidase [Paludibacter sp.]MDD4427231.1 M23 family metallopeptidase [Paludibacter sp.]
MRVTQRFLILILALPMLLSKNIYANDKDKKISSITLNADSTNFYQELLHDKTDDLMENHPADDIYNNIWTSTKLNPYKIPIDSLPDSVKIDLSSFCVPVPGHVTSHFGPRRYRYHYGTDIKLQTGDSVVSSFAGKIRIIDYDRRGYGHYVVIRHDNGLETVYAHLSQVLVSLDQHVAAGEPIALGGSTGRSTGPHLHYEIRFLGNAMNPAKIIDFAYGSPFKEEYLITKKHSFYYQKEVQAMAAAKYYKIRRGDNLSRIASRNGTSVKALCRLNGISTKKMLRIGQTIRIR